MGKEWSKYKFYVVHYTVGRKECLECYRCIKSKKSAEEETKWMSLWSWSCLIQRGFVTSHSQLEALLHSFLSDFLSLASLPVFKSFGLQSQFSTQENKTWSYHWASSSRDFDSLPCFLSSSIPSLWLFPRREVCSYDYLWLPFPLQKISLLPEKWVNGSDVALPSCWTRNSERMRVNFLKPRFQSVHLGIDSGTINCELLFFFHIFFFLFLSSLDMIHPSLDCQFTVTSNYSLSRTTNRPSLRW